MSQVAELVVIIRPSFKKFCAGDACRAALYNHLLYRLARKAKGANAESVKNGEIFWYGSAEDICEDMGDDWCVNKIRKEVKGLVDTGILGQRRNPNNGWDQRRHYYMSAAQGARLLQICGLVGVCLRHIGLTPDVLHLLNMVNGLAKEGECTCQIKEMQLPKMVDASTINGNAITKGTTEGFSEGTNQDKERDAHEHSSEDAIASQTPSLTFSELIAETDAHIEHEFEDWLRIMALSRQSSQEKQAPESVDHNTPQSDVTPPVEPTQGVDQPTINVRIAPTSTPDNANKQDEQGRRMRTVAPKPPKNTSMSERIERVFLCLDRCAQEVSQDTTFTWTRSASAKKAIKELLESGKTVTEERAERVYKRMATMKPTAKGFTWADKMSIRNFCSQFDSQWLEILAEEKAPIIAEVPRPTRPEYQKVTRDPNAPPLSVYVPEKKKVGRR